MDLSNRTNDINNIVHKLPESDFRNELFEQLVLLKKDIETQKEFIRQWISEGKEILNLH